MLYCHWIDCWWKITIAGYDQSLKIWLIPRKWNFSCPYKLQFRYFAALLWAIVYISLVVLSNIRPSLLLGLSVQIVWELLLGCYATYKLNTIVWYNMNYYIPTNWNIFYLHRLKNIFYGNFEIDKAKLNFHFCIPKYLRPRVQWCCYMHAQTFK